MADEEAHQRLYRGASGQMAVLSEFLYRQINVAVPEVDVGDDVFVVKSGESAVTRVQVKQAKAETQASGNYVAQFMLPWGQFNDEDDVPPLVYVLAVRLGDRWSDFLVARRPLLFRLQGENDIGTVATDEAGAPAGLKLRLVFSAEDVKAKGAFSLQGLRNAFLPWPPAPVSDPET